MWLSIVVAAVLFSIAIKVFVNACHPILELHLRSIKVESGERTLGDRQPAQMVEPLAQGICALSDEDRNGFTQMWVSVRGQFQANPSVTIRKADLLMSDLIEDYERTVGLDADLVLQSQGEFTDWYRSAHEIAVRSKEGCVKPHELDRAMGLYAVLFNELLGIR
ncbi:MAG TPA: hypothetical protein VFC10_06815 [Terriglobia bacterium]|nr:hypothetical protein [Terriglobia bacterium]